MDNNLPYRYKFSEIIAYWEQIKISGRIRPGLI